jgi:hypothetical protein
VACAIFRIALSPSTQMKFDGKEGALEYYGRVGSRNLMEKRVLLECFCQVGTWNLRERRCTRIFW